MESNRQAGVEQRNAERDREIIAAALANPHEFIAKYGEIILHWMDRAVAAEQRVAELESTLRSIIDKCKGAEAYTNEAYAHLYAYQALKGAIESEDRG